MNKSISVKVDGKLYNRISCTASDMGLPMTEYIRLAVVAQLDAEADGVAQDRKAKKRLNDAIEELIAAHEDIKMMRLQP